MNDLEKLDWVLGTSKALVEKGDRSWNEALSFALEIMKVTDEGKYSFWIDEDNNLMRGEKTPKPPNLRVVK